MMIFGYDGGWLCSVDMVVILENTLCYFNLSYPWPSGVCIDTLVPCMVVGMVGWSRDLVPGMVGPVVSGFLQDTSSFG